MIKNLFSFDTVFRVSIGVLSAVAAVDMTTILIRVNDSGTRDYHKGDYVLAFKHASLQEGDLAVIIDPFENREKVRRIVAMESKFMYGADGKWSGRRRNLIVPPAHWWCESDIPDETGALDSCAVHEKMVEAKVLFKLPAFSSS
jgi:hypothetical protein